MECDKMHHRPLLTLNDNLHMLQLLTHSGRNSYPDSTRILQREHSNFPMKQNKSHHNFLYIDLYQQMLITHIDPFANFHISVPKCG